MTKKKGQHRWIFSAKRREALKAAQREHVHLVALGKRARARGMR